MAKPLNNSENYDSLFDDPSFKSRKRARGPSDDNFSFEYSDETHKTRRVNPQRLATRLGPELVAEMEALIIPGAKMPTFEVRKVFQEKYSVDRRHIYDYFHSRGLRVAKEDKHTNLTRGRLAKALQKQMQEAQMRIKSPETIALEREDRNAVLAASTKPRVESNLIVLDSPLCQGFEDGVSATKLRSRLEALYFAPHGSSAKRPRMDATQEKRYNNLGVELESPCPEFTMVEEESRFLLHNLFGDLPSGDADEITADFSINLPFDTCQPITLFFVDEHRPLTESERMALYDFVNDNTEPSEGIEERIGTYYAYMEERSRLYYERLFLKGACKKPEMSGEHSPRTSGDNVGPCPISRGRYLATNSEPDLEKQSFVLTDPIGDCELVYPAMYLTNSSSSDKLDVPSGRAGLSTNTGQHNKSWAPRLAEAVRAVERCIDQPHYDVSHINEPRASQPPVGAPQSQKADPHVAPDRFMPDVQSFTTQQPTPGAKIKRYQTTKPSSPSSRALLSKKTVRQTALLAMGKNTLPYFVQTDTISPDRYSLLRTPLLHSKPTRLRTASAGGGI